jgi:hypothetical protein
MNWDVVDGVVLTEAEAELLRDLALIRDRARVCVMTATSPGDLEACRRLLAAALGLLEEVVAAAKARGERGERGSGR